MWGTVLISTAQSSADSCTEYTVFFYAWSLLALVLEIEAERQIKEKRATHCDYVLNNQLKSVQKYFVEVFVVFCGN